MRAVLRGVLTVLGLVLTGVGATGVWLHTQLGGAARDATVILSGSRLLDVEYVDGGDRIRTTVWRGEAQPLIGEPVSVQVADGHPGWARLAGDGRLGSYGAVLLGAGLLLLVGLLLGRRRRRRRRRRRTGRIPTAVALTLAVALLTGCTTFTEDVDRSAYYAARDAVAAAFAGSGSPPSLVGEVSGAAPADTDDVARAMLALAGLPAEGVPWTAARFLARQVADLPRLCGPVDGRQSLLELMTPQAADTWQAAVFSPEGSPYRIFEACGSGLPPQQADLRVLAATVQPRPRRAGLPGVGVSASIDLLYAVATDDGRTPVVQSREVFLYVEETAPFRVVGAEDVEWTTGPGLADAGLPDPRSWAPVGDRSAVEQVRGTAPAAAAVVDAVAATLATDHLALSRTTGSTPDEPVETAEGFLAPAGRTAMLAHTGPSPRRTTLVLVGTEVFSQFAEPVEYSPGRTSEWLRYDTGVAPDGRSERMVTGNPFALLQWVGALSAAAPTDCDGVSGDRCYAVRIETASLWRPGTPGYREALVHGQRGNQQLYLTVGVTAGLLAGVRLDYSLAAVGGPPYRTVETWTFGAPRPEPPPTVTAPTTFADQ